MKKYNDTLKEYVKRINDDDLKYISIRLLRRIGSDVGEAVEVVEKFNDMDRWLAASNSADDFFNMIDQLDIAVQQEVKKRFGNYEQKTKTSASR
jgi:hypothetical protein